MSEVRIAAEPRTEFGKGGARRTRRAGKIPAVLYGHGQAPRHIALPAREFTNAIKHGRPPTEIRLLHTDDCFVVDVADHDLSTVPELAHTRPMNAGGRGLLLAMNMSLKVGWYAGPDSKHIWAVFPMKP